MCVEIRGAYQFKRPHCHSYAFGKTALTRGFEKHDLELVNSGAGNEFGATDSF